MIALATLHAWIFKLLGYFILITLICLGVHKFLEEERQEGYNKAVAEYTKKQLLAEQAARDKEIHYNKQLQEAQNAATVRDQQIQTLSVAVNNASVGLRDSARTIRNGLPTASIDALRKTADAVITVFADCQGKYGEVAENADRHASDVKTLEQAWPK